MSESEWKDFTKALRKGLGDRVEIDEGSPGDAGQAARLVG
jgi:hypothetical protein